MLNELCDERQIQRCLDNELSPEDTRRLLLRLDELPDGWKILACGFLEERAFSHAVTGRDQVGRTGPASEVPHADAHPADATPDGPDVPPADSGRIPRQSHSVTTRPEITLRLARFWSHPMVSLSLCAAIAFVAGLLAQEQRLPDPATAFSKPTSQNRESVDPVTGTTPPQVSILSVSGNSEQESAEQSLADREQVWLQELQQNLQNSGYSARLRQIGPNILIDNSSESRHIMSLLQQLADQIEGPGSGIPSDNQRVPNRPRP